MSLVLDAVCSCEDYHIFIRPKDWTPMLVALTRMPRVVISAVFTVRQLLPVYPQLQICRCTALTDAMPMNGLMHRSNYDVIRRIPDPYPRSNLRVLVRLFPGHDGQSDDRVLQRPRDRPARDLPADFRRGYLGPKIACSIEGPADTAPIGAPFWRCVIGILLLMGHSRQGVAATGPAMIAMPLKRKQLRSASNSATG